MAFTTGLQVFRASRWLEEPDPYVTPGLDFHLVIWGPVRGLLAGLNPYARPADPGYLAETNAIGPSSPRPPSILLLEGLLALPPLEAGYLLSVVVNCLLLWAGLLLMVRPATLRITLLVALLGSAVVLGGHADFLLGLGQTTPWAVLGMGLILRSPAGVLGGFGLSLVLTTPHTGVVFSLMLLALGMWRLVAWGWGLMALLSLPGTLLAVRAAGDPIELIESFGRGISALAGSTNAGNRSDLGGLLVDSGGLAIILPAAVIVAYLVLLRLYRPMLDEVVLLSMVSVIALSVYHMPYHVPLLLVVGVAAALAPGSPRTVVVPVLVLLAVGVASSFSILWVHDVDPIPAVRVLWLTLRQVVRLAPLVLAIAATKELVNRAGRSRLRHPSAVETQTMSP